MKVPTDLRFTRDHEWLRLVGETSALIGITDYAQGSLGDITFVELPKPGTELVAGASFGVVESVKAASDLFAPIDAVVVEANGGLATSPEVVNQDPYDKGWMLRITLKNPAQVAALLSPDEYAKIVAV